MPSDKFVLGGRLIEIKIISGMLFDVAINFADNNSESAIIRLEGIQRRMENFIRILKDSK